MFRKFKERIAEVSEEVKRDPRFVNGIASVNQLAQQTYSAINKTENSDSRESSQQSLVPSFSQLAEAEPGLLETSSTTSYHKRSLSSDLQAYFSANEAKPLTASASSPSLGKSTHYAITFRKSRPATLPLAPPSIHSHLHGICNNIEESFSIYIEVIFYEQSIQYRFKRPTLVTQITV